MNSAPTNRAARGGSAKEDAGDPAGTLHGQEETESREAQSGKGTLVVPRWQFIAIALLVLALVTIGVVVFPRSFGHAMLWGKCGKSGEPVECRSHPGRWSR